MPPTGDELLTFTSKALGTATIVLTLGLLAACGGAEKTTVTGPVVTNAAQHQRTATLSASVRRWNTDLSMKADALRELARRMVGFSDPRRCAISVRDTGSVVMVLVTPDDQYLQIDLNPADGSVDAEDFYRRSSLSADLAASGVSEAEFFDRTRVCYFYAQSGQIQVGTADS